MLCGRCPISGELAEPWVADAECPELEAHFAHMVCACSMWTTPHWNWVEMPRETSISMMEMTTNHIPITQLHVSHFLSWSPQSYPNPTRPISPLMSGLSIDTCRDCRDCRGLSGAVGALSGSAVGLSNRGSSASDGRASHPSHPRARVTRLPPHSRIGRR